MPDKESLGIGCTALHSNVCWLCLLLAALKVGHHLLLRNSEGECLLERPNCAATRFLVGAEFPVSKPTSDARPKSAVFVSFI